jgi:flagellin-like hook-associated protein FlgL
MTEMSIRPGGSLPAAEERVADAARLAAAMGKAAPGRVRNLSVAGISISADRLNIALAGTFAGEARAHATAASNATEGIAQLQTTDAALAQIEERLSALDALAAQAGEEGLSDRDLARLDISFQVAKAEIDTIATQAEFNGQAVLQGDGAGGPMEVDFRVGTGVEDADSVSVSIGAASVEGLDSDLAAADIRSSANADSARDDIEAAQLALAGIRSAVQAVGDALSFARANGQSISRNAANVANREFAPAVVVDLSRVIAERSVDNAGFDLTGDALRRLQATAIDLSRLSAPDRREEVQPPSPREETSRDTGSAPPSAPSTETERPE